MTTPAKAKTKAARVTARAGPAVEASGVNLVVRQVTPVLVNLVGVALSIRARPVAAIRICMALPAREKQVLLKTRLASPATLPVAMATHCLPVAKSSSAILEKLALVTKATFAMTLPAMLKASMNAIVIALMVTALV